MEFTGRERYVKTLDFFSLSYLVQGKGFKDCKPEPPVLRGPPI